MFSTCIHCARDLGHNEAFETFPVGRRLAFDAARGRLWVVCPSCARWNLSPLDARWETIEEAEKRFRGTKLRVSTDNIGMARLREGVDLIRIGEPQRPEMAVWRYADQFGKRRVRNTLIAAGAAAGFVAITGSLVVTGIAGLSMIAFLSNKGLIDNVIHGPPRKLVARVGLPDGRVLDVERRHARMSTIERFQQHNAFALRLESRSGTELLIGEDAMRVAARLLPTINRFGGTREEVRDAVAVFEEVGSDPLDVLHSLQARAGAWAAAPRWSERAPVAELLGYEPHYPGALSTLQPRYRLALEMAVHEESERRAMDGELAALEAQWRDAEEIAHISDTMFTLPSVEKRLEELRGDTAQ